MTDDFESQMAEVQRGVRVYKWVVLGAVGILIVAVIVFVYLATTGDTAP